MDLAPYRLRSCGAIRGMKCGGDLRLSSGDDLEGHHHEWGIDCVDEIVTRFFGEDRERERPPSFAELHLVVDRVAHRLLPRIREDRATAKRTRTSFHSPLEPAAPLSFPEEFGGRVRDIVSSSIPDATAEQHRLDGRVVVSWPVL